MSGGGCINSAECDDANNCRVSIQLYQCCKLPPYCYTSVIGLMGHKDQTIDASTPKDAIMRGILMRRMGVMVIGDCKDFKAGEIISEVDGLPAHDKQAWQTWLDKDGGDSVFTVLDATTHKATTRTIPRL